MKRRGALYVLLSVILLTLISFALLYYLTPIFHLEKYKEKPKCTITVEKYSFLNNILTIHLAYKNCGPRATFIIKDENGNTICMFDTILTDPLVIDLAAENCALQAGKVYAVYINGKQFFAITPVT